MLLLLLLGEEVLMSRAGTGVQSGEELRSGAGFALCVGQLSVQKREFDFWEEDQLSATAITVVTPTHRRCSKNSRIVVVGSDLTPTQELL